MKSLSPIDALKTAIAKAGSQSEMARICGNSQPAVWLWLKRENVLPAEHVLRVEAATGVSRHDLRPDIYPVEDIIEDKGFADPSAAQDRVERERSAIEEIARELGYKTVECSEDPASVVSRDAEAVPQFADDRVEHVGFGSKVFGYCRRALPFRLFNRIRAAAGKMPVERPYVSDQTPARAHGDRLYHIQAILKHVQALIQIERHLLSPSDCESHHPSETGDVAHRLSEGGQ